MKYLKSFEKTHITHDNGGRSFAVQKDGNRINIFKTVNSINLHGDVEKIFSGDKEDDSSSVLLEIKNTRKEKNKYVFVGSEMYEFKTDEPITKYYSKIGNSDVPYPVALSKNYAYFLVEKQYVSKDEFPDDVDWKDAYGWFYGHIDFENKDKLKKIRFKEYKQIEGRVLMERRIFDFDLFEKNAPKKFEPQKVYSEAEINKRWAKKRGQIKHLSKNIRKFKMKVDRDLSSTDEKIRIIACVAKIMEITGERVGNDSSAQEGRHGISNLRKKHINVNGSNITIKYTGKSHVKHEKTFTHSKVALILKELLSRRKTDVFSTSEGQSIKNTQVNDYLGQFNITSKDLRGYKSNKLMTDELRKLGKVKDEKDRKTKFNELLKKVAEEIGHLPATLRKHYLLPEIEQNFYAHGSIGRVQKI